MQMSVFSFCLFICFGVLDIHRYFGAISARQRKIKMILFYRCPFISREAYEPAHTVLYIVFIYFVIINRKILCGMAHCESGAP